MFIAIVPFNRGEFRKRGSSAVYRVVSQVWIGDVALSEKSFDRAAEINSNKLLLVNVLQAQYLDRQKLDQQAFHNHLKKVTNAPDDLNPDLALINGISKQMAIRLLELEKDWF